MSSSGQRLNQFLESLAEDGDNKGTSGFSLHTLNARLKLAEFQLPSPELWVVKLIQAATCGGAKSCALKFLRRAVIVDFEVPRNVELSEISHLLYRGTLPSDDFLAHLVTGLRSAPRESTLSLKLEVANAEGALGIILSNEGFQSLDSSLDIPSEGTRLRFEVQRPSRGLWQGPGTFEVPISYLFKQTAAEYHAVVDRCSGCPIELSLDNRILAKMPLCSLDVPGRAYVLRRRLAAVKGRPPLLPFDALQEKANIHRLNRDVMLRQPVYVHHSFAQWSPNLEGAEVRIRHELGYAHKSVTGRCYFYCDGVIVDRLPMSWTSEEKTERRWTLSVELIIPVKPDELDLSHFRVREPKKVVRSWIPKVKHALLESIEVLTPQLTYFHPVIGQAPNSMMFADFYKFFYKQTEPSATIKGKANAPVFRRDLQALKLALNPRIT